MTTISTSDQVLSWGYNTYAHNTAINESSKVSPYEMVFGQSPNPPEAMLKSDREANTSTGAVQDNTQMKKTFKTGVN